MSYAALSTAAEQLKASIIVYTQTKHHVYEQHDCLCTMYDTRGVVYICTVHDVLCTPVQYMSHCVHLYST